MAPHILDLNFPEINPTGAPEGDYEKISSDPKMFGGLGAEATKTFGEGLTKASDAGLTYLTEVNKEQDQTHASEVHGNFSDNGSDQYAQFTQLEGRAALDALPQFKQKITELQQQAIQAGGNPYTKSLIAVNTRQTMDRFYAWATQHANSQYKVWSTTTAKDNIDSAVNVGGLAISANDYPALDKQMAVIGAEAHNYFDPQGYDDQTLAVQVAKYKGSALKNWVETAATNPKDPDGLTHALEIFERYTKDVDPASRLTIDKYIHGAVFKRTTDRLADYYAAPQGRSVDSSLSPEVRGLLDTIHGSETPGGGYDTLYGGSSVETVKPGFDYSDHPRVMFPAQYGPTSAFGRYQITKTTWDADKDRFGLTDITPESQDQWAAAKASERYQSAYQGAAFKPFSNLTGNLAQDLQANRSNPQFLAAVGHSLSGEWTSLPGGLQPNAATGSFVQRFAKNIAINRGDESAAPDPQQVADRISTDPLFANRPELRDAVLQRSLARVAQQQRAENLTKKANQDQSDAAELKVFADIHSGKPTVTLDSIMADPNMLPNAKMRMATQLESATGTEKADKTCGNGFYDLYRRIHAPDTDPARITDPGELYGHVGPNGDLTVAGVDKLVAEIQGRRTPEAAAEETMKKNFLSIAESHIAPTNPMGIKLPKTNEDFQRFLTHFFPAYEKARAAGKTPQALLSPDSPDYLGKSIATFASPLATQYYEYVTHTQQLNFGDTNQNGEPGKFDPAKVKTLDDLKSAYFAGNVSRAVAIQMSIDRGWAVRKPPPAPMPQVPMSQ